METDRIIASLAARQHAAVGRRQLLDAGVPAHAIAHRVRTGRLVQTHPGVYRLAGSPVTWPQRIMAATLAGGAGAVASHRAAGFLHGLEGIEPRPEVTVNPQRSPHPRGVIVHRVRLSRPDIEIREGIARTRPPATILGLAAVVPGAAAGAGARRRTAEGSRELRPNATPARRRGPPWPQRHRRTRRAAQSACGRPAVDAERVRAPALALLSSIGWRLVPVTWEDLVEAPWELVTTLRRARTA